MVCKVCGAEIKEGARFCSSCGTPVENVPAEAAETADRVLREKAPAGESPAAETPAAPEAASGGPVPSPAEPDPIPPAGGNETMRRKKTWLIPVIAAAVVVLALIIFLPRLFGAAGKPVDQYHKVELKGLKNVTESAANYYGNLLSLEDKADNLGVSGSAELSVGEDLVDLVGLSGLDLDWLKALRLEYEFNRKDEMAGGSLTLKLNKDKVTSANLILDQKEQKLYLQAPDISKNYLGADTDSLSGGVLGILRDILPKALYYTVKPYFEGGNTDLGERAAKVMEALPGRDQFKKLLDKYLEIAVNSIDSVEREKDTLEAGDVSAQYTALTVTLDQKTAMKIAENVLKELKKDKEVAGYVKDVAKALDADPEDIYGDFIDGLDEALEEIEDARDNIDPDDKQKIVMTLYVDGKGNIAGREIKVNFGSSLKFRYAVPVKGGKLGIDVSLKQDSETLFSITGSGKLSGSALSFDAVLKVQGAKLLEISVDKLDGVKLKQGYFKGIVTLKPGAELMDLLRLPGTVERIVKKLSLSLDLDTAKNSSDVTLIVNYDDASLVSLALAGKSSSAKKITAVKDSLDTQEWVEELKEKDLKDFLKNLKKTDIPSEYLEELESLIERIA